MATVRKTITLTAQQDAWIAAQIDAGSYTNHPARQDHAGPYEAECGRDLHQGG